MTRPLYLLTTVDTEEEWDWSGPFPSRGAGVSNIAALDRFQQACERHGIAPTYFTDHAVMADPAACATMQAIAARPRVEVGMHIHPWNTPPIVHERPATPRESFLHNLPPEVIDAKLETAYDALANAGLRPTSFRGGRYSSGGRIHAFLRRKRFVADCSVVPYTTWADDGAPDFRDRGVMPARLAPETPGGLPLWEIPLSRAFSRPPFEFWARTFGAIEAGPLSRLRLIGIAERLGLVRRVWLNFELFDPHDWSPFVELLRRIGVPCVTLTVHSSSLVAGPGPYTRSIDDERRIQRKIEETFAALTRLPGVVPATASEVAGHLEKEHASSGHQPA